MEAHVYFTNKCSEIYILKIMNHKRKAKLTLMLLLPVKENRGTSP
jgi:hypothetical protein